MKPINNLMNRLACAAAIIAISASVSADLLDVQPGFPQVTFGGNSSATVDLTAAPSFDASSQTLEVVLAVGGDINIAAGADADTTIQIDVDSFCNAISGVAGDDLSVSGTLYDPSFNIIKSGVLLTGEITEAGNSMATDTVAVFDFRAIVTGGVLVTDGDWPTDTGGSPLVAGIQLTLEGTNAPFATNDCSTLLTAGVAKGVIGPDESVPPDHTFTNPGTGTQGYWRNHPEAWPVDEITIGGVTYPKADAIDLMDRAPKGDKTYNMFRQLIAAMLNILIDNDNTCIQTVVDDADQWLTDNPLGSNVRANADAWSLEGDALHEALDSYNNGQLCAPHRD
ncbi:MAG: hypothetical protein OEU74_05820 [Gammaproteobacteria bacterium]|nr:hypothetical protein [Gammaproteobacteria bacterium]